MLQRYRRGLGPVQSQFLMETINNIWTWRTLEENGTPGAQLTPVTLVVTLNVQVVAVVESSFHGQSVYKHFNFSNLRKEMSSEQDLLWQ